MNSHLEQVHLDRLGKLQNADGGWGFTPACESRIEPTAWALLALQNSASSPSDDETINRGLSFVGRAQLDNGSWPAVAGQREGCWVTSVACWALLGHKQHRKQVLEGLRWLNSDRPQDSGLWWRLIRKLTERRKINAQSASLSGWSWTPRTASWVEPTCYAMIVHRCSPEMASLPEVVRRRKLAEAMLWDRMCPGGGWNCGNPMVYGVAGQPQVGPTVWALIALRENSERAENRQSLDWLENEQVRIQSPESLALAHIGLGLYERSNTNSGERLRAMVDSDDVPWTVPAVAWAALAFSGTRRWLNLDSSKIS